MKKIKPSKGTLVAIFVIIAAFILLAVFGIGDDIKGVRNMRYGIDIRGGVEAIFEPEDLNRKATKDELEIARTVMENRLDSENITDREVTIDQESGYIIVRFPWKSDETAFNPEEAIQELGEMAKLTFQDSDGNVMLEGKNVKSATAIKDSSQVMQGYVVQLTFDETGADLFAKATEQLVGKQMGIYMDEVQISNPKVETKITGGTAVINGMADYEEASALAEKINAGSLPFSLATTSFSTISPSLGSNALQVMMIAGVLAFVLVCLFMVLYYRLPGLVACFTLLLQMILQLLAISIPQYTLTLPGIAGVILSLGMAVDANIIISERISEELLYGKSIRSAVKAGYHCAFTSLLDGNVTTAIVAVILMYFGSGSMLSFGYTLLIGMIANLFVGVTVSKYMLLSFLEFQRFYEEKYFRRKRKKKPIRFYERKQVCAWVSGIVIVTGILGIAINGVTLDTQFTGGVVIHYSVDGSVQTEQIEKKVEAVASRPVTVQITESRQDKGKSLEITMAGNAGITPEMQQEITECLEEMSIEAELDQTYAVEPYIGEKALKNAVFAIILAFVFILIYVWRRFIVISGLSASITAVIALLHDVMVVFFAFVIFQIPLNDAFVAVLLTIIGYSINDTIVVYDRIRENRKNDSKKPLQALVNESVSQVLARSVNSSLTTGLCVFIILVASIVFHIDSIYEFALPMFFGIISGCYSSVCIASTLWAIWENRKRKGE